PDARKARCPLFRGSARVADHAPPVRSRGKDHRGRHARAMTPWARRLLIANVAMFLVTMVASQSPAVAAVVNSLVLVPALIPLRPWTIVTYAFLHAGVMHLLFNMIGLFFFGPRLENALGSRHFLGLYFTSAVVAALASLMTPMTAIV